MSTATLHQPATPADAHGLTDRQREIFEFVYGHARDRGFQPSYDDIRDRFGIRSRNGVAAHVKALARKGWIEEPAGMGNNNVGAQTRAFRLLRKPDGSPFTGFADKPAAGSIDDLVDRWHAGDGGGASLREFLGMTPAAYDEWARTGKVPDEPE